MQVAVGFQVLNGFNTLLINYFLINYVNVLLIVFLAIIIHNLNI